MNRRRLFAIFIAFSLALLFGYAKAAPVGPRTMSVFASVVEGRFIHVESATGSSGAAFPRTSSFKGAQAKIWRSGGRFSPSREPLPEWVEFVWSEPPYPHDPKQTPEELRALPRKTQRVPIQERVPADVVQAIIASNEHVNLGEEPDYLWLYFVWTHEGIKVHWEQGGSEPLRYGGDDIDAYYR